MENGLTNDDYTLINSILTNAIKINFIYEELCAIEIDDEKNSIDYLNRMNLLKMLIEEENTIYESLQDDYDKTSFVLNFFTKYNNYSFEEELDIAKRNMLDDVIRVRIINKLYNLSYLDDDIESIEQVYENDNLDDDKKEEVIESIEDELYRSDLENYIEIDIIKTILFILNRYINDSNYQDIKEYLISFKYTLNYMYDYIEKEYIDNNFTINDKLYLNSRLFLDLSKGDDDLYNDLLYDYCSSLIENHIIDIINFTDNDLEIIDNYAQCIITQIILRSAKMIGKDMDVKSLLKSLNKEITKNINIKQIVNNSLNSNDEELPYILSLKRDL